MVGWLVGGWVGGWGVHVFSRLGGGHLGFTRPGQTGSSGSPCAACLQNEARRQKYDSYAEHAMRTAGIPMWDIAAYGGAGANRPGDIFHFDGKTMRDMNLDMAEHILC